MRVKARQERENVQRPTLNVELSFEVSPPPSKKASGEENFDDATSNMTSSDNSSNNSQIKTIRFYPDGFIGDKSPAATMSSPNP